MLCTGTDGSLLALMLYNAGRIQVNDGGEAIYSDAHLTVTRTTLCTGVSMPLANMHSF
jgi:hypothetical protein